MLRSAPKQGNVADVEIDAFEGDFYRSIDTQTSKGVSVMVEVYFDPVFKAYVIELPGWPTEEKMIIHGGQEEALSLLNYSLKEAKKYDTPMQFRQHLEDEVASRAVLLMEKEYEEIPQTLRPNQIEEVRRKLRIT